MPDHYSARRTLTGYRVAVRCRAESDVTESHRGQRGRSPFQGCLLGLLKLSIDIGDFCHHYIAVGVKTTVAAGYGRAYFRVPAFNGNRLKLQIGARCSIVILQRPLVQLNKCVEYGQKSCFFFVKDLIFHVSIFQLYRESSNFNWKLLVDIRTCSEI